MFTILIIEDDNALRSGLEFDLAAEGYSVVTAENGKTALERLDSADIALIDVNLPDMEGFELCRELKNKKNNTKHTGNSFWDLTERLACLLKVLGSVAI